MATTPEDVTGRAAELAAVTTFLDAVANGPAAMVVEGEAGIGKTTVWRAAVAAAVARGYRVAVATAVDLEADLPFVVLRDLVEPAGEDVLAALPATQRHAVDVALRRVSDPSGMADQHAVSVAVLGIVRAMAAGRPLLVAVDDVGWIDRSSERVLRYVARRLVEERVGVVVARRSGREPQSTPLGLDDPPFDQHLHRLVLEPLSSEELVLLTERAGYALPRRIIRDIHRESGGNPFHAVEMARAVAADPGRHRAGGALPLPHGTSGVTAARLAALSPAARRVVTVVAALAEPTLDLVRAAVGGEADDGLAEALDEDLIVITGTAVRFTHPLLRAGAIAAMGPRERRDLHSGLAGVVRDADERAVHLAAAARQPDERVAEALDAAAGRAFLRGAPDVAAALAARAVELTPARSERRPGRQVRTAEYRYRSDAPTAAAELAGLVADLPPGELRGEARLWLATLLQVENRWAEATAFDAAREASGPELRSAVERSLAYALVVSGDAAGADRRARGDRRESHHPRLDAVLDRPRPADRPSGGRGEPVRLDPLHAPRREPEPGHRADAGLGRRHRGRQADPRRRAPQTRRPRPRPTARARVVRTGGARVPGWSRRARADPRRGGPPHRDVGGRRLLPRAPARRARSRRRAQRQACRGEEAG
jgi:hypothetical protein